MKLNSSLLGALLANWINMPRLALVLEYEGTAYHGWQKQLDRPSVQQTLEHALAKLTDHPVATICAGRTDAGVHATGQVVHCDVNVTRPESAWVFAVNSYLPADIRVLAAQSVVDNFDARRSAVYRRYCYVIYNSKIRPSLFRKQVSFYFTKLDAQLMHSAGQYWLGEHDFSSFRDAHCQSVSPVRLVTRFSVFRVGDLVIFDIIANAFLHHMIRNMVGVLLEIGAQKRTPSWAAEVLAAKDRRAAASTALAAGLYLVGVQYPEEFAFSTINNVPWFFQSMGLTTI